MLNRKGQNIAEYSILIAIVVAGAITMQVYVRRGLQGRVHEAVDHAGVANDVGGESLSFSGAQFEPSYLDTDGNVASTRTFQEGLSTRGETGRSAYTETTTRKTGSYEEQDYVEAAP